MNFIPDKFPLLDCKEVSYWVRLGDGHVHPLPAAGGFGRGGRTLVVRYPDPDDEQATTEEVFAALGVQLRNQ